MLLELKINFNNKNLTNDKLDRKLQKIERDICTVERVYFDLNPKVTRIPPIIQSHAKNMSYFSAQMCGIESFDALPAFQLKK